MRQIYKYIVVYFCAFTGPLAGNAILSMLKELQLSYNVQLDDVLLSIPTFMFPFAIFQLFSGTISERWSRRSLIFIGLLIYGLSSIGIALADAFFLFLLMRIGQGVGYAFVGPVTVAVLGDIADRSKYGILMGFYGSAVTAGLSIGPLIGGYTAMYDWRIAFWIFGLISFFAAILVIAVIPRIDHVEKRSSERMVENIKEVVRNRNLVLISVIGALAFFATIGNLSFLSDSLRYAPFDYSSSEVGLLLTVAGLVGIFVSPIAGAFIDRFSTRLSTMIGLSIAAPMIALLALSSDYFVFMALLAVLGAAGTFIWAGLLTISIEELPSLRGTSSSVFNSSRFSGYAIAPTLLAPIYAVFNFDGIAITCMVIAVAALILSRCLSGKACFHRRGIGSKG